MSVAKIWNFPNEFNEVLYSTVFPYKHKFENFNYEIFHVKVKIDFSEKIRNKGRYCENFGDIITHKIK